MRIFERLRDEHGYTGGITIVKGYVHERRLRLREMFVPLRHDPSHAQVDFGEALAVIGGVPRSILYDNTKLAVARIMGDGRRLRTRIFSKLQSHYLFADRFGRPGKGNAKGKVEGLVGYARREFRKFRVREPYNEARKGRRKVWRRTGEKGSRMRCWTNFWRDKIRRRFSKRSFDEL